MYLICTFASTDLLTSFYFYFYPILPANIPWGNRFFAFLWLWLCWAGRTVERKEVGLQQESFIKTTTKKTHQANHRLKHHSVHLQELKKTKHKSWTTMLLDKKKILKKNARYKMCLLIFLTRFFFNLFKLWKSFIQMDSDMYQRSEKKCKSSTADQSNVSLKLWSSCHSYLVHIKKGLPFFFTHHHWDYL